MLAGVCITRPMVPSCSATIIALGLAARAFAVYPLSLALRGRKRSRCGSSMCCRQAASRRSGLGSGAIVPVPAFARRDRGRHLRRRRLFHRRAGPAPCRAAAAAGFLPDIDRIREIRRSAQHQVCAFAANEAKGGRMAAAPPRRNASACNSFSSFSPGHRGFINALAGGGSFLTFPSLIAAGPAGDRRQRDLDHRAVSRAGRDDLRSAAA